MLTGRSPRWFTRSSSFGERLPEPSPTRRWWRGLHVTNWALSGRRKLSSSLAAESSRRLHRGPGSRKDSGRGC